MTQFQVQKDDFAKGRIVEGKTTELADGEILLKIDCFAFTANNITYAVAGDMIGYWQFFPPVGEDTEGWGVLPVWGFADVVESTVDDVPVGDRLFGYFPLATHLKMRPVHISDHRFIDGAAHRAKLPAGYNLYRRVLAEPNYTSATDRERMLFAPLFLTAFCLWDLLQASSYFGAQQVLILSASSKTSIGLAYALQADEDAPKVIGITSQRNLALVDGLGLYEKSITYDAVEDIDPTIPTVIVDMAGNGEVLANLHKRLGDQMKRCINVGLTHWDARAKQEGFIDERSEFFFAPSWIQKRLKDWGPAAFEQKTNGFLFKTAAKAKTWMRFRALKGLPELAEVYEDVCEGRIPANEGLVVKMG
ncbi:MAG: DUF2855 family protein [Bacteroidota bacterium]